MAPQIFDLIVIGAGSGGVRAARISAGHGAKVAVIEASRLGGTCVNLGCVPKKLFAYASHFAGDFADAKGYGWSASGEFDWNALVENKNNEIDRLNGIYGNMLEKADVQLLWGVGRYLKAENGLHHIECQNPVDGEKTVLVAKKVLLATGGRPTRPHFEGAEHLLVSDDLFYLKKLPKSMTLIGGGYIAVEFASIFAGLGVKVQLLLRGETMLRPFDPQLATWLEAAFETRGIKILKNVAIEKAELVKTELGDDGVTLVCQQDGQPLRIESEVVVAAIGRNPAIPEGISIEELCDPKGFMQVSSSFETQVPGLFALGDLLNGPALTPVAIKQGQWLADAWFKDDNKSPLVIPSIPTAVFTHPAIGTVGAGEHELKAQGIAYRVYQSEFRPMKHTLAGNPLKVGLKLLVSDDQQQKVLGMHMFGDEAPETIQGVAVAFDMGVTKGDLDRTLGIHPTVGEEWVTLK